MEEKKGKERIGKEKKGRGIKKRGGNIPLYEGHQPNQ